MITGAPTRSTVALTAVACCFVVAINAGRILPSLYVVGILLLVAVAVAARRRPDLVVIVGLCLVALVPVYWIPTPPGFRTTILPGAFISIALLPVALQYRHEFRLTGTDRLVVGYVVLRSLAYFLNHPDPLGLVAGVGLDVFMPYVAFRLLSLRPSISTSAAKGVILGAVVSAVIAIREYQGVANPFFRLFTSGRAHSFYARADRRFGHPRPEAAFGRPVALGMFLGLAAVLAIAVALDSRALGRRLSGFAAAGLVAVGLVNALSRGPILMTLAALGAVALVELRKGRIIGVTAIATGLIALAALGVFANAFELRDASFESGSVQATGEYRVEILEVASRAENFSLLGKPIDEAQDVYGFATAISARTGLRSIDSMYAYTYLAFGALTALAFVGACLLLASAAFRGRIPLVDRAWAAAILGVLINFVTANLIAQMIHVFWIAAGIVATALQRAADDKAAVTETAPPVDAFVS